MNNNSVYMKFTNQNQWKDYIQNLLRTNDLAVKRAVIAIYNRQTFEEKMKHKAAEDNKRGFSKIDAEFLSAAAVAFLDGKEVDDTSMIVVRNKMKKYWRQLMLVSKSNIAKFLEKQKALGNSKPKTIESTEEQKDLITILPDGSYSYYTYN